MSLRSALLAAEEPIGRHILRRPTPLRRQPRTGVAAFVAKHLPERPGPTRREAERLREFFAFSAERLSASHLVGIFFAHDIRSRVTIAPKISPAGARKVVELLAHRPPSNQASAPLR